MKQAVEKYLQYMSSVKNSSPHTILNYGKDLNQFQEYLAPPGMQPPGLTEITHTIIREFVGHLHDQGLEKSSIARKLAALRSFFKYCVREGMLQENPARLVPTPKLPKRLPAVLSAEVETAIVEATMKITPKDATQWSVRAMAAAQKVSSATVQRGATGLEETQTATASRRVVQVQQRSSVCAEGSRHCGAVYEPAG